MSTGDRIAYTLREAAQVVGLSVRTLEKLIAAGALPVVRVSRKRLILRDDLVAVLVKHRIGGAA